MKRTIFLFAIAISLLSLGHTTPLNVTIINPANTTINDSIPHLNGTTDAASNITYSWDDEGKISGCRMCKLFQATYGEALPESSTVLLLRFNENYGNITSDSSPYGNDGTLRGVIREDTWAAGIFGSALDFNGANYVEVPDSNSLDALVNMTLIAWVKPRPVDLNRPWVTIVEKLDDEWGLYINQGMVAFLASGSIGGITAMSAHRWYCIAGVQDGGVLSVYLEGKLDGIEQEAIAGNIQFQRNSLVIGGNSNDDWYTGDIDELAVYDRALSAGEIFELCSKSLSDGPHRVEVRAEKKGDSGSAVRYFTTDERPPRVYLNEPADDSIQPANIAFAWVSSDASDMLSNLTIDGVVREAIETENGSTTTFIVSGLSPGKHYWNVTSWDAVGNADTSTTRSFVVDTSPPNYNAFGISPVAPRQREEVTCYSIWTDDNVLGSAIVEENAAGVLRNHSIAIVDGWANYTIGSDVLKAGTWRCRIIVSDSAGNNNSTPEFVFNVSDNGFLNIKKWVRRIFCWIRLKCPI